MTFDAIKDRIYFLSKTDSTSYPIADLVASANAAVERIVSLINRADSRWQFDDANQTDLPAATATVTSGQQDYILTTSHLTIDRVELKDTSGNWHLLTPKDQHDRQDPLSQTQSGVPTEYDKAANSIFLTPIPNFSQAASLKIYFTRPPATFSTSDTTKEPGFNSLFHDLVAVWSAYDYAVANGLDNVKRLAELIQVKEAEIEKFYGRRSRDERPRMRPALHNNK